MTTKCCDTARTTLPFPISTNSMSEETADNLRDIKKQLHAFMNGPVSNSLREKGLHYRVIYGVEWCRLQEMAGAIGKDARLAAALWKEDIRECRLLAGLVQPAEEFPEELAEIWIEDIHFAEEAQYTTLSLFQNLPYAKRAAFHWIARKEEMFQLCGFLLFSRLFMRENDNIIDDRNAQEFLDQAASLLHCENIPLQKAVGNALSKYALLGEIEDNKVARLLKDHATE